MLTKHKYPIALVDRVLEVVPYQSIRAIKNVSINEKIFMGHFIDQPIYPAIYTVEGLCQCGQIMLGPDRLGVTAKLDKFKFNIPIYPGDQIIYSVNYDGNWGEFHMMSAKVEVGDQVAVTGKIVGKLID